MSIPFYPDNLLDFSSVGDPISSNAIAGIALRLIRPRKPHHYVRVRIPARG
jgi:hypothetical protein